MNHDNTIEAQREADHGFAREAEGALEHDYGDEQRHPARISFPRDLPRRVAIAKRSQP